MKAIRWIGWVALAALCMVPLVASPAWAAWSNTAADISQPLALRPDVSDSCDILAWRTTLLYANLAGTSDDVPKTRWYNYAGPNSKDVPVLSFKISASGVTDILRSMMVYSVIERKNSISKIYLYRDLETDTAGDFAHYFGGGDILLRQLNVSTAFETNDSILFTGLSDTIPNGHTVWYHLVVDMNSTAIDGNDNFNMTGVMVELRPNGVGVQEGATLRYGPAVNIPDYPDDACTLTHPANNAYSIIIDNQGPTCASPLGLTLRKRTCPNACADPNVISLGDSILITLAMSAPNPATDTNQTGWPKVFISEFSTYPPNAPQTMHRDGSATAFSYVNAGIPDYWNIPEAGLVNHPIDVGANFYYLVAETKDIAGNVAACSLLVPYKIDTRKPAAPLAKAFTLYWDANSNGIVNDGDSIRLFVDLAGDTVGEICPNGVTAVLRGWSGVDIPLVLSDSAGDRKFSKKYKVGPGILDAPVDSPEDSVYIIITDNACNRDSALLVLNNPVDNIKPTVSQWQPWFYRLLDTDSNGCLMIGEKIRIRIDNTDIDDDLDSVFANIWRAGMGDSAGIVYSRHVLYNQGGGVWLLDWTLGDDPQSAAKQATDGPFEVWLYGVDDAGNIDSTLTYPLSVGLGNDDPYTMDTKYPTPVANLYCSSVAHGVINLHWTVTAPDADRFAIYFNNGSGDIDYTHALAYELNGSATSWTTDGTITLTDGKIYKFDVWTRDHCGNWERVHPSPVACEADASPAWVCVIQPDTGGVYCGNYPLTVYVCPDTTADRDVQGVTAWGRTANRGDGLPGDWVPLGSNRSGADNAVCFQIDLDPSALNGLVGSDTTKLIQVAITTVDDAGNTNTPDQAWAHVGCLPFHFYWTTETIQAEVQTINGTLPLTQPYCGGEIGWSLSGATNSVKTCLTDSGVGPYWVMAYIDGGGKQPGTAKFSDGRTVSAAGEIFPGPQPQGDEIFYGQGEPGCVTFNLDVTKFTKGSYQLEIIWIDVCGQRDTTYANLCVPDSNAPCAEVTNPVDGKCIRRSWSTADTLEDFAITIHGNDLTPGGKGCIDQENVLKVDFQWAKACCTGAGIDTTGWSYYTKPKGSVSPGTVCDTTYFPPPFQTFIKKITCAGVDTLEYVLDSTAVTTTCDAGWQTFAIDSGNGGSNYYADWMNYHDLSWITKSGTNIFIRGIVYDDQGNVFYTPCVQVCVDIDTPPLCIRTENLCPNGHLGEFAKILAELDWPNGNVDDIEHIYLYTKKTDDPDILSSWDSQGAGELATNATIWTWSLHLGNFSDQTYYDFRLIAKTTTGSWSYDFNGDGQFDAHTFDTLHCDAKTWLIDRTAPNIAIDTAWTTINGHDLVIPNSDCRLSDPKGYIWTQYGHTVKVQPTVYPLADMGDVVKVQWTLYNGDSAKCACEGSESIFDDNGANSYVFAVNEGAHVMDPLVFDPTKAPFVSKANGYQRHVLHIKAWDGCGNTTEDCVGIYLLDIDTTEAIIIDPMNDQVFCDQKLADGGIKLTAATLLDNYMKKAVFAYRKKGTSTWTVIDSVTIAHVDTNGVLSVVWYPKAAGLTDGAYELTVWAVDKSLNRQTREYPITVYLSCAEPVVALTYPTTVDPKFLGCPLEVTATASSSDPFNPITQVDFYVQSILSSEAMWIGYDDYTVDGSWSVHWDPHSTYWKGKLADGGYYIFATATNLAGLTTKSAVVKVKYDETAPWSYIIQVNGDRSDGGSADPTIVTSGETVPLYVLAADNKSPVGYGLTDNCGLDSVVVYVSNDSGKVVFAELMTPVDSLTSLYRRDWPTAGWPTGKYHVWSRAVDCACNSSTCNCNWYVQIVNPIPGATIGVVDALMICDTASVEPGTIDINVTPAPFGDIAEVQIWLQNKNLSDVWDLWKQVGITQTAFKGIFTVEVDVDTLPEGTYRLRAFYKSTSGQYIDDGNSDGKFDDFTFDPDNKPWQMWLRIDRSVTPFTMALDPTMTLKAGRHVKVTVTPEVPCDVAQVCYGVVAENGNYAAAKDGCVDSTHFSFNPVDSGLVSLNHGIFHGSIRTTINDALGNSSSLDEPLWILDMDSNQVRITSPLWGDYVTGIGDTLTSVTARKLTSATIDSVVFFNDATPAGAGTRFGKATSTAGSDQFMADWNIKDVPEGEQYIWGVAYKNSTKLDNNPIKTWVIIIKTPKNIVLHAPNPNHIRTVGPEQIMFVGGRVDLCLDRDLISSIVSGVGIDSVVFGYRFGDAPGGPVPSGFDPAKGWVRINADRYGSLCVDWFTCDSAAQYCRDGRYAVVAWVYDKAGHVNHSNIVQVMVDCTNPYSEIVDVDGDETFGSCHDITLTGTATTVKFKANAVDDRSCAGSTPAYNSGANWMQFFVGQCGEGSGAMADVVFVIDGTGSMSDLQAALANNTSLFFQAMAGIDARYGVVGFTDAISIIGTNGSQKTPGAGVGEFTTDPSVLSTMVTAVGASGGTEQGLTALNGALAWYPFRSGAKKVLILVTDDGTIETNFAPLIPPLLASGAMINTVFDYSDTTGYSTLAPSTSGLALDINSSTWGANLAALATQIKAVAGTGVGNDVGVIWNSGLVKLTDGQADAFALWNPRGLKTGTYCAWTVVIDQIGNSYTSVPVSLCIYDKTPPVGFIAGFGVSTDEHMNHTYTIYGRTWDTDVDHVQIQYRKSTSQSETDWTGIGISAKVNGDSTCWMTDWNPCVEAAGDYVFRMVPTDKSGNEDFTIQPMLSVHLDGACAVALLDQSQVGVGFEDRAFSNLGMVDLTNAPTDKHTSMIGVYADLNGALDVEKVNLRQDVGVDTRFMATFDDGAILNGGTGWFWAAYNDFTAKKTYLKKAEIKVYRVDDVGFPGTLTNTELGASVELQPEALTSTNGVVMFPARNPTVWKNQLHLRAWPISSSSDMLTSIRLTDNGGFSEGKYAKITISYYAPDIPAGDLAIAWWDDSEGEWVTNHGLLAGGEIKNGKATFFSDDLYGIYAVVSASGVFWPGAVDVKITVPGAGGYMNPFPQFNAIVKSKLNGQYENHDIDKRHIIVTLGKISEPGRSVTLFTDNEAADSWSSEWDDVSGVLELAGEREYCGYDYSEEDLGGVPPGVWPGLSAGAYWLKVQAFNKQGYWNFDSTTFTVDAAKPKVEVATSYVCPNPTFKFDVTDVGGAGVNWDSVYADVFDMEGSVFSGAPKERLVFTASPNIFTRDGSTLSFTINGTFAEGRRLRVVIYDGVDSVIHNYYDCSCEWVTYDYPCHGVPDMVGNHSPITEMLYTVSSIACGSNDSTTSITIVKSAESGSGSHNPFDPTNGGFVQFALNGFIAGGGSISAAVYDLTGERVSGVAMNSLQGAATWYGTTDEGKVVADGVYLVHFQKTGGSTAGSNSQVLKVVVKRK